jgi:uncharacterized phage infection (PIP) family protein YhgE
MTLPPAPPANLVLFSTAQWNWLTSALRALDAGQQTLHAEHESIVAVLGGIMTAQEALMATSAELQTALDELGSALTEALADIDRQLAQMAPGEPVTQAQIDSLRASAQSLREASTRMKADDAPAEEPPTP